MAKELTLEAAERIIAACKQKANEIGQPMNIAVVDDGANLVAFARMDGDQAHRHRHLAEEGAHRRLLSDGHARGGPAGAARPRCTALRPPRRAGWSFSVAG
jgi:hypothetical protein